jgi:hypothetical protein
MKIYCMVKVTFNDETTKIVIKAKIINLKFIMKSKSVFFLNLFSLKINFSSL